MWTISKGFNDLLQDCFCCFCSSFFGCKAQGIPALTRDQAHIPVNYKSALAMGACHLSLQGLHHATAAADL